MKLLRRLLLPLALMAGIPSATAGDLPALKPGDDLLDQPQHLRMLVTSNQLLIERTADGALQYTCFCGPQVALFEIPVHVRNALIAIEDRRFRIHNGIDPYGIGRGGWRLITRGRAEGGSTITQQLCKNRVLSRDRALLRKSHEITCALSLESAMSKNEILLAYFNGMEFGYANGKPIVGIEQAARMHFGKRARDLNPLEGAELAGMMRATGRYNPSSNPKAARARALVVLSAMAEEGYVTAAERKRYAALKVGGGKTKPYVFETRYFTDWVLRDLEAQGIALKPGMRVALTFEAMTQAQTQGAFAQALKARHVRMKDAVRFITMKLDGRVAAMMGGWSYALDQSDGIAGDLRQPASTFKPFIYATALENGFTPASKLLDGPKPGERWSRAMLDRHYGRVTLAYALSRSANIASVRLLREVGYDKVAEMVKRLGITASLRDDEALALGASEVSLLQLAGGFACFANGGVGIRPHGFVAVVDSSGDVVSWPADQRRRVLDRELALAMKQMLQKVVAEGTGKGAASIRGAGGKTGTSDSNRDAWFVGFTQGQVTGVWAGTRNGASRGLPVAGADMAWVWAKTVQSFRGP